MKCPSLQQHKNKPAPFRSGFMKTVSIFNAMLKLKNDPPMYLVFTNESESVHITNQTFYKLRTAQSRWYHLIVCYSNVNERKGCMSRQQHSVGKETCCQAWQHESNPQKLHGGRREITSTNCPLTSTGMLGHVSTYQPTHTHAYTQ